MSKVVIVKCESYDYLTVQKAIKNGINLLGGINFFFKSNEKILLKPNILAGDPPEKGTTTHPSVFKAIGDIILTTGAIVSYGDSPGFTSPEKACKMSGFEAVASELNISLAEFENGKEIIYEKGIQNKRFFIANAVLESDCLVSISKLKTHGSHKFTGSIKNQFGCIPGLRKAEFHARVQDPHNFAKMLLDLNNFIHPRLYIMDAVMSMEGNGPRSGKLRATNFILFSVDPVALDATACRIINLEPELVLTIKYADEFNAGKSKLEDIEIIGEKWEDFIISDFNVDRKPIKKSSDAKGIIKGLIKKIINSIVVKKPYILKEKCIKCGMCVNICPAKPVALYFKRKNKAPVFNYEKCIRCYCCQEICPESAVLLKEQILRKFIKI